MARQQCKNDLVIKMSNRDTFTPGQIFVAKNFYGMVDETKQTVTHADNPASIFDSVKAFDIYTTAELECIMALQHKGNKEELTDKDVQILGIINAVNVDMPSNYTT